MHNWYRRVRPTRPRSARVRDTKKYERRENTRIRKPPTIRSEKAVFFRKFSKKIYINGYASKVMSRYHIAKLFDLPLSTVHGWDRLGVLPKPFMYLERSGKSYPVFLSAQIRCLLVIVRDLVSDGYVTLPWQKLDEYVDVLFEGYASAARLHKKRNTETFGEEAGKFGVIFDE